MKLKIKKLFEQLNETFRKSFLRFPAAIILLGVLCCVFSALALEVDFGKLEEEIIIVSLITGTVFAILCALLNEKFRFNRLIDYIVPVVVTILCYVIIDNFRENNYLFLGYAGINFAMLFGILAMVFDHKEEGRVLPYLLSKLIYVGVLALVAFGGIMICVLAFNFLIYEIEELMKVVLIVVIWVLGFIPAALFISYIPDKEEELDISKAYSTIFNKVALYIYLLLLVILYVYIIKIVVTRQLPVGRLNWFGSIALLFYVFFYLSLQEEGTVQVFFKKFGALLLVPVLVIQLYAIYIRLSAYGLTSIRYISLALIVIAVLFMISSLTLKKSSPVWLAAAVIAMLVTIGPLNLIDVPVRNQVSRLKAVLESNQIYVNGRYNTAKEVTEEDWEIISGSYWYLRYNSENLNDFARDVMGRDISDLVIRDDGSIDVYDYRYIHYYIQNETIDISGYGKMTFVTGYEYHIEDYDGYEFFRELVRKAGEGDYIQDEIVELETDDNTKYVFTHISITIKDDEMLDFYWEAYKLEK